MSIEEFDKSLREIYEPKIKELLNKPARHIFIGPPVPPPVYTWRQEFRFWVIGRRFWLAAKLREVVYWLEGASPYDDD